VDEPRSQAARAAAERALVRVIHHYGQRPEFVLMGGLVPELLCSGGQIRHAGTTDVDVQVNLEIAAGAVNGQRLERALRNAEFEPDDQRVWRWVADGPVQAVIKFELLADLDDVPADATVAFKNCDRLGAVNLRGTRFACRDVEFRMIRARIGGVNHEVELGVSGIAGFLLAKTAAARSRRKPKDWYDIAFVLLHNDAGGPEAAADAVRARFMPEVKGAARTALEDLRANFDRPDNQGPTAYTDQMLNDHPDLDPTAVAADAVVAVETFCRRLFGSS